MRTFIKNGYTLIEVLVAIAVLSVVAVPLTMFLSSVVTRSINDAVSDAATIASNQINEILVTNDFSDKDLTVRMGDRNYKLQIKCLSENGMLRIYIYVKKFSDDAVLFTLYRAVYESGS